MAHQTFPVAPFLLLHGTSLFLSAKETTVTAIVRYLKKSLIEQP